MVNLHRKKFFQLQGMTLFEVLISIWLLSLILFSLIATEWCVLRKNEAAYYLSVAIEQASSLKEYINSLQNMPMEEDLAAWNQENKVVLPNGKGILLGKYPNFLIKIVWGAMSINHCVQSQAQNNGGCYLSRIKEEYS